MGSFRRQIVNVHFGNDVTEFGLRETKWDKRNFTRMQCMRKTQFKIKKINTLL